MVNLEKLATEYRSEGYSAMLADARVCQDIVLKAISESSLNRNVTIKGGVVIRNSDRLWKTASGITGYKYRLRKLLREFRISLTP